MTPDRLPPAILPGATLGILGGGQLGRMLAMAAARLGLRAHVFCPDAECPAADVAAARTIADYEDEAALTRFAAAVDVVTYEFENVPGATAAFLASRAPLRPNARALDITQDRLTEKRFVAGLGIATAPFRAVDGEAELAAALDELGTPAILKTRRFGYDGKGQVRLEPGDRAGEAFAHLGGAPAILEGVVAFSHEVSVVAARGGDGAFAAYEPCLNEHRSGILAVTRLPADLPAGVAAEAIEAARAVATALDYVGVLAVEMFVTGASGCGGIVVNEIAPRVHNSGHWTLEGAETSQFEQHVRAVCGWPLGPTGRLGRIEMRNLIGDDIRGFAGLLADPSAHPHHYGKMRARPGRKMGHVTYVRQD